MGTKTVENGPKIKSNPSTEETKSPGLGLGDMVAVVAQPIARAIGKDPNCAPCKARQEYLNSLPSRTATGIRRLFSKRIRTSE